MKSRSGIFKLLRTARWFLAAAVFVCVPLNSRADSMKLLAHGAQSLAAMRTEIAASEATLDMTSYMYDPCSASGKVVTKQLLAAAKRGVKVRLLLDSGIHQDTDSVQSLAVLLQARGIQVKFYNERVLKYTPLANTRLHAKMIIADKKSYITGGRNIGDDYFGLSPDANYVDRDVAIAGASAQEASASFERFWKDQHSSLPVSPTQTSYDEFARKCLPPTAFDKKVETFVSRNARSIIDAIPTDQCTDTHFVADDPRFSSLPALSDLTKKGSDFMTPERMAYKHTTRAILGLVQGSAKSLTIENWDYMPGEQLDRALEAKRTVKVPVKVITNLEPDVEQVADFTQEKLMNDNVGTQTNYPLYKNGSLNDNWELTPRGPGKEWRIHSKTLVADGKDSAVGSFNMDRRSYASNLEATAVVRNCPILAKRILNENYKNISVNQADSNCEECKRSVQQFDVFQTILHRIEKPYL